MFPFLPPPFDRPIKNKKIKQAKKTQACLGLPLSTNTREKTLKQESLPFVQGNLAMPRWRRMMIGLKKIVNDIEDLTFQRWVFNKNVRPSEGMS